MDLNRPRKRMPDGVSVFDKPIKAKVALNGKTALTHIEGFRLCACSLCVYINPYPDFGDDNAYAVKLQTLKEVN